jgi:MYXO-CTERM domain-containing protein
MEHPQSRVWEERLSQMKTTTLGLSALAAVLCAATTGALAQPDIGGTPIHTEGDYFTGGPWGLDVFSYVFDFDSELPENFGGVLDPDEMLFIYLLDGDNSMNVSVDTYSVGNPNLAVINAVGWTDNVIPDDYFIVDYQDPFAFSYSGPAQATVYTYSGNPEDPFSTLDPDEWSMVWYIAVSPDWEEGPASASGGGIGDTEFVPVPIPAPGALAVLGLAGLLGARRRRN